MKTGIKLLTIAFAALLACSFTYVTPADAYEVRKDVPRVKEAITGTVGEIIIHPDGDTKFVRVDRTTGSRRRARTVSNWVAVPAETAVSIDEQISFKQGVVMKNYNVKGLKRTFDKIVFSQGKNE